MLTWREKDKHIFMLLKLVYNVSSKYKTRGWTDACPLWTYVCPSWLDACLLWTYVCPTRLDRRPSTLDTWLSKLIPFFNFIPEGVNISKRYFTAWLIYIFFNFWRFYFFKILKYFPWAWTHACPRWTYACPGWTYACPRWTTGCPCQGYQYWSQWMAIGDHGNPGLIALRFVEDLNTGLGNVTLLYRSMVETGEYCQAEPLEIKPCKENKDDIRCKDLCSKSIFYNNKTFKIFDPEILDL